MRSSEKTDLLSQALSRFQAEIQVISATAVNPRFNTKYADLADVVVSANPLLAKNGLSHSGGCQMHEAGPVWVTRLMHSSGQWLESDLPIYALKSDMQGLVGAVTYARRAAIKGLLGLAEHGEDDDGNKVSQPMPHQHAAPSQTASFLGAKPSSGYVIPFGKHKGKTVAEVGIPAVHKYCIWLQENAASSGKPLSPDALELFRQSGFGSDIPAEDDEMTAIKEIPF